MKRRRDRHRCWGGGGRLIQRRESGRLRDPGREERMERRIDRHKGGGGVGGGR